MRARRSRSRVFKIVVTGPVDAGKTTLIQTISETTMLSTERAVTDDAAVPASSTTVAMDFGRLSLPGGIALHLFGTPGQERFEFMRAILAEGMLGFVLMVDGTTIDHGGLHDARRILDGFTATADVPFVVAVNKIAGQDAALADKVREELGVSALVPVLGVDARERADVKRVLLSLMHELLAHVRQRAGGSPWHAGDLP